MFCFLVVSYCKTELTQHAITDKQRSQWTQFIAWTLCVELNRLKSEKTECVRLVKGQSVCGHVKGRVG